jgi:putative hemolysin
VQDAAVDAGAVDTLAVIDVIAPDMAPPVPDGNLAGDGAGVANPASVNCTDNGGSLDIRTGAGGQYGVCVFKDGSECEEWAFFRGQCQPGDCDVWETCKFDGGGAVDGGATASDGGGVAPDGGTGLANPASVNCAEKGGSLDIRSNTGGQYGVCVFKDGSECEEWAFFRGQCQPGDCEVWETCKFDGGGAVDGGAGDAGATVSDDGGAAADGGIAPALDAGATD